MNFSQLPALSAPLDGGTFAGITTQPDGTHCAVVLLPDRGEDLDHPAAVAWAQEHGGQLPTRPIAAMLFANCKPPLQPRWHWCQETKSAIELHPGEHYAGPVLDEAGQIKHHLVLLPDRPAQRVTWQDAIAWAEGIGAQLPDRQEQALLFANCKPHLQPGWHWSCLEEDEEDASCAWGCGFHYGGQYGDLKSFEGSAVAVRRLNP